MPHQGPAASAITAAAVTFSSIAAAPHMCVSDSHSHICPWVHDSVPYAGYGSVPQGPC